MAKRSQGRPISASPTHRLQMPVVTVNIGEHSRGPAEPLFQNVAPLTPSMARLNESSLPRA